MATNQIDLPTLCASLMDHAPTATRDEVMVALKTVCADAGLNPVEWQVRVASYSRRALRLVGAAYMPATDGEHDQFREQAGSGYALHGDARPHTILICEGQLLELGLPSAMDHHPIAAFAAPAPPPGANQWSVTGLPMGTTLVYERLTIAAPAAEPVQQLGRRLVQTWAAGSSPPLHHRVAS